jgi:hypothetical protein
MIVLASGRLDGWRCPDRIVADFGRDFLVPLIPALSQKWKGEKEEKNRWH